MIYLRKNFHKTGIVLLVLGFLGFGCTSKPTILQSAYEVDGCRKMPTTSALAQELLNRGYLQRSDKRGAAHIFHKPRIEKTGILASEPYADRSGDIGVAVCSPAKVIAVSEVRSCKRSGSCTESDQKEVGRVLESFGCKVAAFSKRSISWELDSREDWNDETCGRLVSELEMKE